MTDSGNQPAATDGDSHPADGDDDAPAALPEQLATLAGELKALTRRVESLERAVADRPGADRAGRGEGETDADGEPSGALRVVISPATEIALTALVENGLRGLAAVRRMSEILHGDREDSFELEIDSGPDELVEALREALPIPFEVKELDGAVLTLSIKAPW